ncbi:MAG: transposase [Alphaproteobacteria bacterium]|nr:transposase [Alphaproteobacteria bacterium]MBF0249748.1 transposase [Alphaproteobacteria bacterium]
MKCLGCLEGRYSDLPEDARRRVKAFPTAEVTVDGFHVARLFTEAVDDVHKAERRRVQMPAAGCAGRNLRGPRAGGSRTSCATPASRSALDRCSRP